MHIAQSKAFVFLLIWWVAH